MFDIFTWRNVKKNLLISTLTSDQDQMSDQIVGLRVLTLKFVGHFGHFVEYVGPECLIVDTLGEYCRRQSNVYKLYKIQYNV